MKPDTHTHHVLTRTPEETQSLAATLARRLAPGSLLCLHGTLGVGKTCFTQGLARGLGITRPVGSPTFTLINEYPGVIPLVHIDLYRLQGEAGVWELGVEDYFYSTDAITVVEWAERAGDLIPPTAWHIHLFAAEDGGRKITFHAPVDLSWLRDVTPEREA